MTTCRSLQSLLTTPSPPEPTEMPSLRQLPTPPLAHAPPPLKLRLRSRAKAQQNNDSAISRKRIVKRAPPRGISKRRRAIDDDMGRDDSEVEQDVDSDLELELPVAADREPSAPSTPKRARIAPEQLPLGLERSDFHHVHLLQGDSPEDANKPGTNVEVEADGEQWSAEDDRILVELVLEKLKLSKTEWQDCARSLGKDRQAANRRWKSLIMNGEIGLKTRSTSSRRAKLHSTWR